VNLVTAAVTRLQAEGWAEPVYAWRRWHDPQPGSAVVVLTMADDWSAMRTTAEAPVLRVLTTAAPHDGQDDAEAIAVEVADRVRAVLHRPQGGAPVWGAVRVISSMHAGSGLAEVEGHEGWFVRSLVFDVLTS